MILHPALATSLVLETHCKVYSFHRKHLVRAASFGELALRCNFPPRQTACLEVENSRPDLLASCSGKLAGGPTACSRTISGPMPATVTATIPVARFSSHLCRTPPRMLGPFRLIQKAPTTGLPINGRCRSMPRSPSYLNLAISRYKLAADRGIGWPAPIMRDPRVSVPDFS